MPLRRQFVGTILIGLYLFVLILSSQLFGNGIQIQQTRILAGFDVGLSDLPDQLFSENGDVPRRVNRDPDTAPLYIDNADLYVIAYDNGFARFSGDHQHRFFS